MFLAIDAGNTNIVFALYQEGERKAVWRCRTVPGMSCDEYASFLKPLFLEEDISFADVRNIWVGSVVPDVQGPLQDLAQHYFSCDAKIIAASDVPMPIAIRQPEEVGVDRLLNALAIKVYYQCPAVIVDFGTATTFDVIDEKGRYCGGAIAPGPHLSMQALYQGAAKLPKVEIKKPSGVIGKDTEMAMQSGLYWGYLSMIEGMLERLSKEMGVTPYVVGTGGLAYLFAEGTELFDFVDPDLTLKGLVRLQAMDQQTARRVA